MFVNNVQMVSFKNTDSKKFMVFISFTPESPLKFITYKYELFPKGFPISSKSDIFKLNTIFDYKLSCIRLSGRLKHANLDYNKKYPIIIHPSSRFSKLIIRDTRKFFPWC